MRIPRKKRFTGLWKKNKLVPFVTKKFDKVIMKKVYGTDDGESPCFFYWRTIWKSQRKTNLKIIREPNVKSGNMSRFHLKNAQQGLD